MTNLIAAHAGQIPLADESVQCVVTSPPYWGLRRYAGEQERIWGCHRSTEATENCAHEFETTTKKDNRTTAGLPADWNCQESTGGKFDGAWQAVSGTCVKCGAWRGAYGLEPTVEMYVAHTIEILREVRRVLRADGVVFWNVGDSYSGSWANYGGRNRGAGKQRPIFKGSGAQNPVWKGLEGYRPPASYPQVGLKPKDLCLIPMRVALAAQADGWWVRSVIIWAKPNPMPESVTDRPTDAYEHILMLTKSAQYFWDAEAVDRAKRCESARVSRDTYADERDHLVVAPKSGRRNLRNVWTFATQPYSGAHFATFPEELPRRCIKAATSMRGACRFCGAPWERIVRCVSVNQTQIIGWRPGCECRGQHGRTAPCVVLDPFGGSGTTGRVSLELNRRAVLLDLAYGGGYEGLAGQRTRNVQRELILT